MNKPVILNNTKVIDNYCEYLELQGKQDSTITQNLWQIYPFFRYLDYRFAENVTKEDVRKYILHLTREVKKGKRKESTLQTNILGLRTFFKWFNPDNDFFTDIKLKRSKPDTSNKMFVNRGDVIKMLNFCSSQRDRAFLFLMWDTGARLSEILDLNVDNVRFDKYGGIVTVTGKTGKRDIRIIDSVPDVQLYINQIKGAEGDPLFPTNVTGRLTKRGAQNIIARVANKTGIDEKNVHPHSFRHGRLTELSNLGVSEMQLRIFAGWSRSSEMPSIYINPTGKDLENKLLSIAGIEQEEEKKEQEKVKTSLKICPRCQIPNSFDSKYCRGCSFILDQKLVISEQNIETGFKDYLQNNPELFEMLIKRLREEITK